MMPRLLLILVTLQFGLVACTCSKKPVAPTLKKEGEACTTDDSCETGLCDAAPGQAAVCYRKCASGCNEGEICDQLTENRFSCQKDPRKLCEACQIDSDCPYPGDKCVVVNGEKVCGRDCAFDQNCPTGYSCRNALGTDGKAKLQQCTPTVASCACLARGDLSQPCSLTNSYGTCKGLKTCDLVSNTVTCNALAPGPESCNGIDDNCNGTVDEDQPTDKCGVGACQRTVSTCQIGTPMKCVPGMPVDEQCNGIDDDCDGTIDNGFPVDSDPNNCGACKNVCKLDHAVAKCEARTCLIDHCIAPWLDKDGDPSNGCEFMCGDTDFPDAPIAGKPPSQQFLDSNCDGIDGEINNAIFVSPYGNDSYEGTMTAPKKTVQAAVIARGQLLKRDIYLASGTYVGPLELSLAQDMAIAGGYDSAPDGGLNLPDGGLSWQRSATNVVTVQGGNPALRIESVTNVEVQLVRFVGDDATVASPGRTAYGAWVKDAKPLKLNAVVISAGKGADGPAGAAGATGSTGGDGTSGDGANIVDNRSGSWSFACNVIDGSNVPNPGQGGSSCMYPGGRGGMSSRENASVETSEDVVPGNAGDPAPSGDGIGGAGLMRAASPTSANNGTPGSAGTAGSAAGVASLGTLSPTTGWVPGDGKTGSPGTAGKGGGGGGGGAGGWTHLLITHYWCQSYGSPGGGGGGGGCGGQGGEGGKGGGASIGLFVTKGSTVSGSGNSLSVSDGGKGGAGGAAGAPGPGGKGGVPEDPPDDFYKLSFATKGGVGGNGGAGGSGGVGSGGAGGSVFGIARSTDSTVTGFSGATMGSPGSGGSGTVSGPTGDRSVQTTF